MTLTIPDEILAKAGLTERDALIEFACRLFDAGKLSLPAATRLTGLSRTSFEQELLDRNIPIYRITLEEFQRDIAALEALESKS